jgi:hypothetical protein
MRRWSRPIGSPQAGIREEGCVRREKEEEVTLSGARKEGGIKVKSDKAVRLGGDKKWPRQ